MLLLLYVGVCCSLCFHTMKKVENHKAILYSLLLDFIEVECIRFREKEKFLKKK